ncbi:hypothetical protein L2E82_45248 [Cichorium intybus]|uniref:Uncharacterized protein n=1 Tax=Cichorium intybus TaxID=13427 RepID=A0ACB8ZRH1_CICIN|nr:hypothetical protein L2E82_45248 [Cichorium intybus]
MKKGYLKITKKRKGQDEDIQDVKRSDKSAKLIYLYYTHFTVKPFPRGLPAISSWDIMILRQCENFQEKSGGFGRCPIIDDVIVEPKLQESPVPFKLSPTLLEEVIKSCKNIEAKKEMENKEKSLMPSFDLNISQDEFSSLSDESLKDLITINYPLFKRGLEEDMKHDVEIQDFQKVDLH